MAETQFIPGEPDPEIRLQMLEHLVLAIVDVLNATRPAADLRAEASALKGN